MKNIILYGAGKRGRAMYAFLKSKGANDIITGFCDKKHDEIQKVDDLNVYGIDEVRGERIFILYYFVRRKWQAED